MTICIRADASIKIGSGHVMRCLTLAEELRDRGNFVLFICRDLQGNLSSLIQGRGFTTYLLPKPTSNIPAGDSMYAEWLGVSQEEDVQETLSILQQHSINPDWFVLDHYGIDYRWHQITRQTGANIFCIDDLANRRLHCDILLDQNLYHHSARRYSGSVPKTTIQLLGPHFALLRSEFYTIQQAVIEQRKKHNGKIRRIFVFFGGSDPTNETKKTIEALSLLNKPEIVADIIVGAVNPHREEIRALCQNYSQMNFYCQVDNIAEYMANADIALGAGGSTTWERCCLGLPTLTISLAENQSEIAQTVDDYGLQKNLGWYEAVTAKMIYSAIEEWMNSPDRLTEMSKKAFDMVDGLGVRRVVDEIVNFSE